MTQATHDEVVDRSSLRSWFPRPVCDHVCVDEGSANIGAYHALRQVVSPIAER